MNLRQRLLTRTDHALAVLLVMLIAGTTLAFGGRVWWGPPVLAALTLALGGAVLARSLLEGRFTVLKSPLTALAVLAIGLGVFQVAPLPGTIAGMISPASHEAYRYRMLPERVKALDPTVELPAPAPVRSPVSLDRPATLRWIAVATACLAVFWGVSRFADRLGHLYVVWGAVVAAFFVNTAIAVVQLACGSPGVYGFITPGRGAIWAPNAVDLLEAPGGSLLRDPDVAPAVGHLGLASTIPSRPFHIGSQLGGPEAYLALAAVALPLALALTLQLLAPRGSREALSARLAQSGQTSLVTLLYGMLLASALVVGILAGPLYSVPFGVALVLTGLPGAWASGLRWSALGLTFLVLTTLGGGAALGKLWEGSVDFPAPVAAQDPAASSKVWSDSLPIARDFPLFGTGLGTFPAVYPYYKTRDVAATTASSSLLQWWVEAGAVGLALLGVAMLWVMARTPGAVRRVGTADRALAFGLIGAASGFTLYSLVNWTVELASVSLAASAVGGTLNRWLAGGTDLFVERG